MNLLEVLHVLYGKLSVDNISLLFFFIKFPLCGLGGLIITLSHSFFSHSWLRSNLNIYVGIILPIIGLTITTVIGSNIALSLGMIGALSIVRFRTPVRSAYELVHYFSLLTIGVAGSVDISITIVLIIILTIIPFFIVKISNKIKINKSFDQEKKQIFLNIDVKLKLSDLPNFEKERCVQSYTADKKEQEIVFIKAFTYFETLEDKNIFLNKWKNSINSFDVSKEKINVR